MRNLAKTIFILTALTTSTLFNACSDNDEAMELTPASKDNLKETSELILKSGSANCNDFVEYDLVAGQNMVVGNAIVTNDEENLLIFYSITSEGLYLTESHVYVGPLEFLPVNKKDNPVIGKFNLSKVHKEGTTSYLYEIPLSLIKKECLTIAMHGVLNDENTIWAKGDCSFGKDSENTRWGWFICEYCIKECVEDKELVFTLKTNLKSGSAVSDGFKLSETGWCQYLGYTQFNLKELELITVDLIDQDWNDIGDINIFRKGKTIVVDVDPADPNNIVEETWVYLGTPELLGLYLKKVECPEYRLFPYSSKSDLVTISLD